MTVSSVPGKIILFGEHAVVYGRPAIAIPVREVTATVAITEIPHATQSDIRIVAPDIHFYMWLHAADPEHPLAKIVHLTLNELDIEEPPPLNLLISSTIPVAAGLGSGAAVSVAIVRALSAHLGKPLPLTRQSNLAFEVERIYHGTPSGIDNTVVTYDRPIYFVKDSEPVFINIGSSFPFIIGDTGLASHTAFAVSQVNEAWDMDRIRYEALFDAIGMATEQARDFLEHGDITDLGPMMDHCQSLLERIGVSSPKLNELISAARRAGAGGAKLSGAGLGGNMIALVEPANAWQVEAAIQRAGATRTIRTEVLP
jgi:mevalonate kinase